MGTLASATLLIVGLSLRKRAAKHPKIVDGMQRPQPPKPAIVASEKTSRPSEIELDARASTGHVDPRLRPTFQVITTSVASTVAAFSLEGDDADYAAHDERAQHDASRVEDAFRAIRDELSPDVARSFEAVVELLQAAQLRLMAFAINRKNRGTPDSSQVEAEVADRKAFENDVRPLIDQLKTAVG